MSFWGACRFCARLLFGLARFLPSVFGSSRSFHRVGWSDKTGFLESPNTLLIYVFLFASRFWCTTHQQVLPQTDHFTSRYWAFTTSCKFSTSSTNSVTATRLPVSERDSSIHNYCSSTKQFSGTGLGVQELPDFLQAVGTPCPCIALLVLPSLQPLAAAGLLTPHGCLLLSSFPIDQTNVPGDVSCRGRPTCLTGKSQSSSWGGARMPGETTTPQICF